MNAAELVALYDERIALTRDLARHPHPTGTMAQAVLDKGAELDAACEQFRREHHPRKHRVIVAQQDVYTVSRQGRSIQCVHDGGR